MRASLFRTSAAALAALSLAACGPSRPTPAIAVSNAWAAPSANGARTAAGYLTIVNSGRADDHLVSASSPRAAQIMIHETAMAGGMSTMHAMHGGLAIAAGKSAALEPGAGHLMFVDITAPFVAGQSIPVKLRFEKAGEISTSLPVRAR